MTNDAPPEESKGLPRGLLIGGIVVIILILGCAVCVVVLAATGILAGTLPALPGFATPTLVPTPIQDLDLDAPATLRLTDDGWELHDTYVSHYVLTAVVGDETGTYDIDLSSAGTDGFDLYIVTTNPGTDNQQEIVHLVILPEAAYLEEGARGGLTCRGSTYEEVDDWLGYEADVDDVLEDNLGVPLESFLSGLPPLERVMPNEVINGVESRHYAAQGVSFPIGDDDDVSIGDATVDAWVAREGGFATRIFYEGDLVFEDEASGRFTLEFDLVSHNQPLTVTLPDSC